MALLLQIVLVNLVVSCDNVGVIALATRGLPPDKARAARRLGVLLSVALKFLFVAVTGLLFDIPWLHIRIVGGAMLLYVTFNMMRHATGDSVPHKPHAPRASSSYGMAIVTILAADVSMSLDNVIAVLSIASVDGGDLGGAELAAVLGGFLVCVPLLLWFSETVARLMERYALLTYLCAGYLVYTAVHMMLQDATIALLLERVNFRGAQAVALLCGLMVLLSGLFTGAAPDRQRRKRRKSLIPIFAAVAFYAFASVGVVYFLSTNPVVDGIPLSAELVFRFTPSGVGAVYLIHSSSSLLLLSASILTGRMLEGEAPRAAAAPGWYRRKLAAACKAMAVLIGLVVAIGAVGLSVGFGFGRLDPAAHLGYLFIQLLMHFAFAAVFCTIATFTHGKVVNVALCMVFTHVLEQLAEVCLWRGWHFLGSFVPTYHIYTAPLDGPNPGQLLRAALVAALYIGGAWWVGVRHCSSQNKTTRTRVSLKNT